MPQASRDERGDASTGGASIAPSASSVAITPLFAIVSVAAIVSDMAVAITVPFVEPLSAMTVPLVAVAVLPIVRAVSVPIAMTPVSTTRVMFVHHHVRSVETEEEQVPDRGDVVGGNAAEFILETRFEIVARLCAARPAQDRERCCGDCGDSPALRPVRVMGRGPASELPEHWGLLLPRCVPVRVHPV